MNLKKKRKTASKYGRLDNHSEKYIQKLLHTAHKLELLYIKKSVYTYHFFYLIEAHILSLNTYF